MKRGNIIFMPIIVSTLIFACSSSERKQNDATGGSDYNDLVTLYKAFREFQKPKMVDGVPDYTAVTMRKQKRENLKYTVLQDCIGLNFI